MDILLIAGSPSGNSRSAALLHAAGRRLESAGQRIAALPVRELSADALVRADFGHPSIADAAARVAAAHAVVVATPVYKAAYSGVLKVFLDLLPQTALRGKTVLPIATGGSPHHMLALDYALRPVLQALGARHILPGLYASDAQVVLTPEGASRIAPEIGARLDDAVAALLRETPALAQGADVAFSQVRCSY